MSIDGGSMNENNGHYCYAMAAINGFAVNLNVVMLQYWKKKMLFWKYRNLMAIISILKITAII